MNIVMHWHDWLALFGQYMLLSMLSISGAITTVPDMHRYLVAQHGWLTDAQFTSSVAIAQAAPGPNVLFVGLMGWNVGLNSFQAAEYFGSNATQRLKCSTALTA